MFNLEVGEQTMNSWARWTVRIVAVIFGLLIATDSVSRALDSTSTLGATTDEAARRTLQLAVAGELLIGAGLFGICVCTAFNLPHLWRRLGQTARVPGGRRGRRRAMKQIDGKVPYRLDKIAHLRWLSERRIADRRWSLPTWLTFISLIAFCAGYALSPPQLPPDVESNFVVGAGFLEALQVLSQIARPFMAVMALGLVVVALVAWRMRNDVRAKVFLERTRPVGWPTDGGH